MEKNEDYYESRKLVPPSWATQDANKASTTAPMHIYASGMKRSSTKPRFDLLDSDWLRGVAQVMTEGAEKYGPNNWKLADRTAAIDAVNHLQDHLLLLKDGDTSEAHIFNLSCNAMFIAYYLRKFPDLFQNPKTK